MVTGRLQEATEQFQRALQIEPNYFDARYNLGSALFEKGQFQQAIDEYQLAVKLRPDSPDVHYDLGAGIAKLDRNQEAVVEYRQAIELKPGLTKAWMHLALAYAVMKQPEQAIRTAETAASIELLDGKAFTSDSRVLGRVVSMVSARGQTALYDAVAEGLKHLELGNREKKALIIVSDGGDNASRHKYSEVLALARQAHAVIYSIGPVGSTEEENPRALDRLCKETGGIAFFPRSGQKISDIAGTIARDLREQYTLGYAPAKEISGSSFRKIAVKVVARGRGRLRVRTRAGYLARTGNASTSQSGVSGQ